MTVELDERTTHPILEAAREAAREAGLPYAGGVSPQDAWALVTAGSALLVDVRTAEERAFVGHVPDSLHVPWATGTSLTRNPRFVRELEAKAGGKDTVVLLLCRSGNRSAQAAEAAAKAGFSQVFNVLEGFEGDLDGAGHRGAINGWRLHGLPWQQS
ncbi:rhodanese [Burkholderia singularis]|uniref:Rhodanese n=1 Tax=Burkholderia singularis TaxID=1503053 RepID=A0A118DLU1_9BURK|nr:rhodanese-like domain-containing protein [Burkholderia singularis]KVE23914.1 rhodanese [Burkholderia singularis]SMF99831.1 Rhodanese-like domain protein [Burkholderia singularis]